MSGSLYGGNSSKNVETSPLNVVAPKTFAIIIAVAIPMKYIAKTTFAAFSGKNITANSAKIGTFALQVKNGVIKIEIILSLCVSSARAPIIAGTPQPKPIISGIIPLPVSPARRIIGSITKATRAMYPVPSKKLRQKNNVKISGTKLKTLPTPTIIPSDTKDSIQPATPAASIASAAAGASVSSKNSPSMSASGCPIQLNAI